MACSQNYNTQDFPAFYTSNFDEYNTTSDFEQQNIYHLPTTFFQKQLEYLLFSAADIGLQHNSPALSTQHSLDESNTDRAASALSWGTASLCDSISGMTSSPSEDIHHSFADFSIPWTDTAGSNSLPQTFTDDAAFHFADSEAYSDLHFDVPIGGYDHATGLRYPTFVDPSVVNTLPTPPQVGNLMQNNYVTFAPSQPLSPPLSLASHGQHGLMMSNNSRSTSPHQAQPYLHPSTISSSRLSPHSISATGTSRSGSTEIEDEGQPKNKCPYPDCGKIFKDLKAHMLTHQDERPEKCPIPSCEFHKRGFARKYDRNRHLVTTHYKSTIVCGFCPGSGSAAEKSFNRTDVFKRHLISVHGVEQTPPNGRRKSPITSGRESPAMPDGTTGRCSTCNFVFKCAQDLFEHLDDCVLRVVQQVDPAEANNEKLLMSVAEDEDVKTTMKSHGLDVAAGMEPFTGEEDDDNEEETNTTTKSTTTKKHNSRTSGVQTGRITKSTPQITKHKFRTGLTLSKNGVILTPPTTTSSTTKSQRRRREYPRSWGCPADNMSMKKRVLCVFDGQRRLWKDDMMLGNDQEVRVKLGEGDSYVTDLDVQSLRRAEGVLGASEEERGPWVPTNVAGNIPELLMMGNAAVGGSGSGDAVFDYDFPFS